MSNLHVAPSNSKMISKPFRRIALWSALLLLIAFVGRRDLRAAVPQPTRQPIRQVVDLSLGETSELTLANGAKATVRLVNVAVERDTLRGAVRSARVRVEVNGTPATLPCANYTLPTTVAGVQIDCTVVKAYLANSGAESWALAKDARLRIWPAGSPLMEPGTFAYPVKQVWFATGTQQANEPTFVDGGEDPNRKRIYYHNDLDFGGCEGLTEVVAATDGVVVVAGREILPGYEGTPAKARYDGVFVLDERGWFHWYLHLQSIDSAIKPGAKVTRGQAIGVLGKEGDSGGWSHLHYGIFARQPSGGWGTEEAYAYAWEAYRTEHRPAILAVARPHHFVKVGERVVLDGSKSLALDGGPVRHEWTFSDGTKASGPTMERRYEKPGEYSEVLQVTDSRGRRAYDFAVVLVVDPASGKLPPAIHPTYWPSLGIKPNAPVTFKVRTFGTKHGEETWDFGDGSPRSTTRSDGGVKEMAPDGYAMTTHRFARPGTYVVTVERSNEAGEKAIGHLAVTVAE